VINAHLRKQPDDNNLNDGKYKMSIQIRVPKYVEYALYVLDHVISLRTCEIDTSDHLGYSVDDGVRGRQSHALYLVRGRCWAAGCETIVWEERLAEGKQGCGEVLRRE